MQGIKNALKGVQYSNPQLGERLYEICRKATSRHIDRPDEILNQQVVYMINSDMHAYGASRDAVTCLKRRLQMDHPQKQFLAIILTSKVLQECHASIGAYQGELLQEVAYILRSQHTNSPAAARTRQAAMDALRHFGAGGVDAYRQARQHQGPAGGQMMMAGGPGGMMAAPGMPVAQRDPAAIAAERESLLDEIKRLVEQAGTSTELLNELILNKTESAGGAAAGAGAAVPDESAALRKELLSDVRELRRLLDGYMGQLAGLSGPDAESAMKQGLEAVDQLDAALTLEKDVDAEIRDLQAKGQLPAGNSSNTTPAAGTLAPPAGDAGAGSSSSAAAAATAAAGGAAAAAATMQSMNLIDLDDEPPAPAASAAAAAAPTAADPFGPAPPAASAGGADPFAAAAFPPAVAAGGHDPSDPFAALAAAPVAGVTGQPSAFDASAAAPGPIAAFPPLPAETGSAPAAGGDPFADAAPAWGSSSSAPPPAAAAGFDSLAAAAAPVSGGGVGAGSGSGPVSIPNQPPQQQQQQQPLGSAGGSAAAAGAAFLPPVAAYGAAGLGAYGSPAAAAAAGMTGPYGGYAAPAPAGYGGYGGPPSPYGMAPAAAAPAPYGLPVAQMAGGQMMMPPYPQLPGGGSGGGAGAAYGAPAGAYPSYPGMMQQQPQMMMQQQQPQMMMQQQPYGSMGSGGGLAPVSAPPPTGYTEPGVVLSPTNPFASSAGVAGVSGGGGGGGAAATDASNPFGAAPAPAGGGAASSVDQEWNAFFARGQAVSK